MLPLADEAVMRKFSIGFSTSTTGNIFTYGFLGDPAPLGHGMTSEVV